MQSAENNELRLKRIKESYDKGDIKASDIDLDDFDALIDMYRRETVEVKASIAQAMRNTAAMMSELAESNSNST